MSSSYETINSFFPVFYGMKLAASGYGWPDKEIVVVGTGCFPQKTIYRVVKSSLLSIKVPQTQYQIIYIHIDLGPMLVNNLHAIRLSCQFGTVESFSSAPSFKLMFKFITLHPWYHRRHWILEEPSNSSPKVHPALKDCPKNICPRISKGICQFFIHILFN